MRIVRTRDYDEMSLRAAEILAAQVVMKPDCVLGLATGSSPVGLYKVLTRWCDQGRLDFSKVKTVNLDEYRGLAPDHEQSYRWFMNTNLFDHINIDKKNTHVPDGCASDPEAACKAYDGLIRSLGGQDVQLLGLGQNGHIGFNEPSDSFAVGTHIVKLTESTIEANKRFFASRDEVPKEAITMGVGNILQAKKIVLVANGKAKAKAVADAFFGPVTPKVPASVLQLHPDVIVICDEDALSLVP
ncbi:MAG: glucosamine-6-phosphate deaminase [Lachnospiraceae bacterium]|jgi:glucosamine-6-phosphate deaminase